MPKVLKHWWIQEGGGAPDADALDPFSSMTGLQEVKCSQETLILTILVIKL